MGGVMCTLENTVHEWTRHRAYFHFIHYLVNNGEVQQLTVDLPARSDDSVFAEYRQVNDCWPEAALVSYWTTVYHHSQLGPKLLKLLKQKKQTFYDKSTGQTLETLIVSYTYMYFYCAGLWADVGAGER